MYTESRKLLIIYRSRQYSVNLFFTNITDKRAFLYQCSSRWCVILWLVASNTYQGNTDTPFTWFRLVLLLLLGTAAKSVFLFWLLFIPSDPLATTALGIEVHSCLCWGVYYCCFVSFIRFSLNCRHSAKSKRVSKHTKSKSAACQNSKVSSNWNQIGHR